MTAVSPVGTLLRPFTMDTLARQAGYRAIETLPIEHPFRRSHRLLP
jgi:hypothetical protein